MYKITYLDAASLYSFCVIRVTWNARRIETELVCVTPTINACVGLHINYHT